MELKGKEVATIVMALKNAHFDELAEKVIKHFNDLGERFGEVWWTKEDIENAFDERTGKRPTEEQIEEAVDNIDCNSMEEAMIQSGWEFIYNAVDMVIKGE